MAKCWAGHQPQQRFYEQETSKKLNNSKVFQTINHELTVCLMIDGSMDNGLMVYEFMKRLQNIKI